MVGDQHHRAGRHVRVERAGGIGQKQLLDANLGKRLDRRTHRRGIGVFVIMRTAGQHDHVDSAEFSGDDLAGMTRDAALRKARQVPVRHADRIADLGDEIAEAGAEDQRHFRRKP